MAALSDPRAFISAQEKRNQQLKAMGIEETDIKDSPGVDGISTAGAGGKKGSKTGGAKGAITGSRAEDEKKGTLFYQHLYQWRTQKFFSRGFNKFS
jgi:hypothetical protein